MRDWNKNPFHSERYRSKKEHKLDTDQLKELFLVMLDVYKGNVTAAVEATNISRSGLYLWRENDPEFKTRMEEVRDEVKETRLDNAEQAVDVLVDTLDGATVRWFLDRQGRDRGYGQVVKQRHGGVDGPRIPVDIQGDYPPVPATLEEWEEQQRAARKRRAERQADTDA